MLDVHSKPLMRIHRQLQETWVDSLTDQDKQRFHPHITLMNKGEEHDTQQAYKDLSASLKLPIVGQATGLDLFAYEGGGRPWRPIKSFPFQ